MKKLYCLKLNYLGSENMAMGKACLKLSLGFHAEMTMLPPSSSLLATNFQKSTIIFKPNNIER